MKKTKILTISDHPLSPSGVGTQTKYMIEAMLKTDKYSFVSLGGAIKHRDYQGQKVEPYGDDWRIYPVDGYGNHEIIRSVVRQEKPDIVWIMTDPRFWTWLWEIENEIRANSTLIYYHVWDNYPHPHFNKRYYESNDIVVSISKVTNNIVKTVAPDVKLYHLPHAVDDNIFKRLDKEEIAKFKQENFPSLSDDKMIFFWNNRNARRKQSGTVIWWFAEFLERVGKDKAMLLMHTDVRDPNGQDLEKILHELELVNGEVMFSTQKIAPEVIAQMYNMADCTINISDAEGFGLATMESLACETPIIVNMTGGLQEQVTDGKKWFGIGIEPVAKSVIGSLDVPYIYEDRLNKDDFINALEEIYNMSKEERTALGKAGRKHLLKNYNYEKTCKKWDEIFTYAVEHFSSWENRKNRSGWTIGEVA
mgnify:CR=1 FL=1